MSARALPTVALSAGVRSVRLSALPSVCSRPAMRLARRALRLPGLKPVTGERCVDQPDPRAREDQPDPAVPVGRPADRLVEAAHAEQRRAANGGEAEDEVLLEDRAALLVLEEAHALLVAAPEDPAVQLQVRVRGEDVEVGPCRCEPAQGLDPLREEDVVGVEDDDELPRRRAGGAILRRPLAAVLLAHEDDAVEVGAERLVEIVGGAVVHDHHLMRGDRLVEGRLDRLAHGRRRLVGGDDDRERRWSLWPHVSLVDGTRGNLDGVRHWRRSADASPRAGSGRRRGPRAARPRGCPATRCLRGRGSGSPRPERRRPSRPPPTLR